MIGARLVHDRGLRKGGLLGMVGGTVLVATIIGLLAWGYVWISGGANYDVVMSMGISGVLVIGLQIFMGGTGITSFGHMAFVAVGAYTAGILSVPVSQKLLLLPDLPGFLQNVSFGIAVTMLMGALIAGLFGLLAGAVLMRLSGSAASITTLALLVITNEVMRNATSFTRGNQTFFGVPKASNLAWVYGTLVVVAAAGVVFKVSGLGLQARAVRDDPLAAETSGVRVLSARLWAFVLSAAVTGLGGALYAHYLTAFSPGGFFISQSIPIIVMLILGGLNSVLGGLTGTVLLTVWLELVRRIESGSLGFVEFRGIPGVAQLSVGIMIVLLLYWLPNGVMGSRELQFVGGKIKIGRLLAGVRSLFTGREERETGPGDRQSPPGDSEANGSYEPKS